MKKTVGQTTFQKICMQMAGKEPMPGGGVAATMSGALAASLVSKVIVFTREKKDYQMIAKKMAKMQNEAKKLIKDFQDLADEDSLAYSEFRQNIGDSQAIKKIIDVPLKTSRKALRVLEMAAYLSEKGNPRMIPDSRCALELGTASFYGALEIIRDNFSLIKDARLERETREEIDRLLDQAESLLSP